MRKNYLSFIALLASGSLAFADVPGTGTLVPIGGGGGGGGGSGTVSNIATTCGVAGGPITTTGTISASIGANPQSGTSYTFLATDCGNFVTFTNASAIAGSLANANFSAGNFVNIKNLPGAAGVLTLTPTSGTIDGASSLTLQPGQGLTAIFDGTNWTTSGRYVIGPSSATSGHLATFSGTSGQVLQDGGAVPTGLTLAGSSGAIQTNNGSGNLGSITPGTGVTTALGNTTNATSGFVVQGGSITNGHVFIGGASGPVDGGLPLVSGVLSDVTYAGPQTNTSLTINANASVVTLQGCGPGGGGGGGNVMATPGTGNSGGAGGGGGECHFETFKVSDLGGGGTTFYVNGGGGGSGGAAANPGTAGTPMSFSRNSTGCSVSSPYAFNSGSSDTSGCFDIFGAGGGGGAGQTGATISVGGAGGSHLATGASASTTSTLGCVFVSVGNGGGNGGAGISALLCGSSGTGGPTTGAPFSGAYSVGPFGAPGGGGGGGTTAANAGSSAASTKGGGSPTCPSPPSGGGVGGNGNSVSPIYAYYIGCGGSGGGGATSGTGGTGGAGTNGGGGGGGGSAITGQTAGPGGAGGNGFIRVIQQ